MALKVLISGERLTAISAENHGDDQVIDVMSTSYSNIEVSRGIKKPNVKQKSSNFSDLGVFERVAID